MAIFNTNNISNARTFTSNMIVTFSMKNDEMKINIRSNNSFHYMIYPYIYIYIYIYIYKHTCIYINTHTHIYIL